MYKCLKCGHVFSEGEQACWEESHGLDTPPYERWSGCPNCHGEYDEAYLCAGCDEWHFEIKDELCNECVDRLFEKYSRNAEACYEFSKKFETPVPLMINGFLASMFSENEIEDILMRELANADPDFYCKYAESYINESIETFVEAMRKVVII